MAETNAVFGGEHSGHFYFRDFWRADSGLLAALHAIAALGETPVGTTMSSLLAPFNRYASSGEINTEVVDQQAVTQSIANAFTPRAAQPLDWFDLASGLFAVLAGQSQPCFVDDTIFARQFIIDLCLSGPRRECPSDPWCRS
jgi:phosphomannomutase